MGYSTVGITMFCVQASSFISQISHTALLHINGVKIINNKQEGGCIPCGKETRPLQACARLGSFWDVSGHPNRCTLGTPEEPFLILLERVALVQIGRAHV